jgi:hypothetical protein
VAAIALADIVEDEVYLLSEDELAVLEPRLRDAERGENLIGAKDVDILNEPRA